MRRHRHTGDPGLPANFPKLPEITFVSAEDKEQTHVVDGFATDEMEGVYHEMKDRFQEEQYTILFSELEEEQLRNLLQVAGRKDRRADRPAGRLRQREHVDPHHRATRCLAAAVPRCRRDRQLPPLSVVRTDGRVQARD